MVSGHLGISENCPGIKVDAVPRNDYLNSNSRLRGKPRRASQTSRQSTTARDTRATTRRPAVRQTGSPAGNSCFSDVLHESTHRPRPRE